MNKLSQSVQNSQLFTPQDLKKYNRESGKKTLIFVGILIALIVILTILSLLLMSKPQN